MAVASRDRLVVCGRALAVVAALSIANCACSGGGDGATATNVEVNAPPTAASAPTTVEPAASLPPLEVPPSDVIAWLTGGGAALREVRRIGYALLGAQGAPSAEVCNGWVQELAGGPDPEQLVEAAGTSPDPVIGDALGASVVALNRVLSRCVNGESLDPDSLRELHSQLALVDEREASL